MCGKDADRNPSSRRDRRLVPVLACMALLASASARAEDGLWDKALETLNLKSSPADRAPDFVERTRPDPARLGFIPTALPHKVSPAPVKSASDVSAATAALDAAKERQLRPGGPGPIQLGKGRAAAKPKSAPAVAD